MHDPIDTSQWQRLGALFDQAIDMDAAQQAELLRAIGREDAELARALASLLAADARHQAATAEQRQRVLLSSLDAIEAIDATVGDRVGPFVLREILGRGGMGVVFRAERVDGQVRQEVALKIVRHALLDASGRERFLRERQIVAAFAHPCIARMLDVGQTADGSPYLAMELIRGLPITGYCDTRKFNTRRRVEVFLRVCEAVQHAHANMVLHRDLKPGNVLVGNDGVPKLIDFGIAKPLTILAEGELQQTTTTHRFFSPCNVAPEQLRGDRVGVTCDVYQLGTLLHELLCGAAVFDSRGLTPGQLEDRILEVIPEAPSERASRASVANAHAHGAATPARLARKLRGDLDAIVDLALRKVPEERYDSAEHLADDLRRYLDGRPVTARRGQSWYRSRKFLQRHALVIGATAVILALFAGMMTAIWIQAQQIAREGGPLRETRLTDVQRGLSTGTRTQASSGEDSCRIDGFIAPANYKVFAAVGASGRMLDFDFERRSGARNIENDIVVNDPDEPVVLILSNAGPVLWNLSWTKGTRISAVFVNGQFAQAVAGLPRNVPMLISTTDAHGACGNREAMGENLGAINALSERIFGHWVDTIYPIGGGNAQIVKVMGDPVRRGTAIISGGRTPESYRDPDMPYYGDKGLDFALSRGLIRAATTTDVRQWTDAQARPSPSDSSVPPADAMGSPRRTYVVLKPLKLPGGLNGADSARFYIPKGVPVPTGNPGQSTVFDFNTMTCKGPRCTP